MRNSQRLLTIAVAIGIGVLALPSTSAFAAAPTNFGSHVSGCAQTMGMSGTDNPGMHRGMSGWDGLHAAD